MTHELSRPDEEPTALPHGGEMPCGPPIGELLDSLRRRAPGPTRAAPPPPAPFAGSGRPDPEPARPKRPATYRYRCHACEAVWRQRRAASLPDRIRLALALHGWTIASASRAIGRTDGWFFDGAARGEFSVADLFRLERATHIPRSLWVFR